MIRLIRFTTTNELFLADIGGTNQRPLTSVDTFLAVDDHFFTETCRKGPGFSCGDNRHDGAKPPDLFPCIT